MRIAQTSTKGSFYESFSDLIFGTLVLFIVVVMALALKIQAAAATIVDGGSGLLSVSQFSGSATATELIFTALPRDKRTHFIPVPENISRSWGLDQDSTKTDAILEFCRWVLADELLAIPVEDLPELGEGLVGLLNGGLVFHYNIGEALFLIDELRRQEGGSLSTWTALRLRKAISGSATKRGANVLFTPRSAALKEAQQRYRKWSKHGGQDLFYRDREIRSALYSGPQAKESPKIKLRVGKDPLKVWIGERPMGIDGLRAVLRAVRTGRGFALDVQPRPDGTDLMVVTFRREVLAPIGFDLLVVRPSDPTNTP